MLTHKVPMTVRTLCQRDALTKALDVTRTIYNAGLEERSGAWSKNRIRISKGNQQKSITALKGDPSLAGLPVNLLRWPLEKLDKAFDGFFSRVKKGQTPGYPRFRADSRWDTFGYTDRQCWKVVFTNDDHTRARLELSRIGTFRLRLHRPIIEEVRSLQIKREGRRWYALIKVRIETPTSHADAGASVGIDVGTTHLGTLSTGERVANVRTNRRFAGRIAAMQRGLARAKYGSKRRKRLKQRYLRLKRCETNARNTHLHQVSADITRRFGTVVIEDLRIANMTRSAKGTVEAPGTNVAQKAGLNRSIADASWGRLGKYLSYKAERAGGRVVRVDPRNSSNECHQCHAITPSKIGGQFHCHACGLMMDRDHNAALVIEYRGVVVPTAEAA